MVDTHCHLDSCDPADGQLVSAARDAGVTRIATVGMHGESIRRAVAAAHSHEEVVAIVGRHPHHSEGFGAADLEEIDVAAGDPQVRAVGEIGLDYFRDRAPRGDQRRAFEGQLDLAARIGLPVVIHTREAEDDTFAILAERARELTVILHCFSTPNRLDEAVERGYLCSFAGNVTYPKAGALQEAARRVPVGLLLVETDAPYLAPQPVRGKPNAPANVLHTARFLAELRDVSLEELDRTVHENSHRVFGW